MAIYHLEAKVVSRGAGRSACAASAYLSCSAIYNDYDGIQHDYTRKRGLVWEQVFLPECAPVEWQDRGRLWNAVEENEKTKDSRLAREFVPALPAELTSEQWKELLTDFIQSSFVSDGMCADVAIHDPDPPGHNPHAHILLTVRPLNPDGSWQYKTEKEYLCVRNGEERGFTASEFKDVQADGWEKQYPYKVGRKKVYMAPSEAEAKGYVRQSKHPKSTKYGRQNPITERWNSEEQLILWREAWANAVNRSLERYGFEERIDHRSHAARGLEEQPTVHEGVTARALEAKGIISDRCELNRQIKRDNALLRDLKAQVAKLVNAVRNTIPTIADAMESLRRNMIIFSYQIRNARRFIKAAKDDLAYIRPKYQRYHEVTEKIRKNRKAKKELMTEKKTLSPFQFGESRRISQRLTELTEDYEELKSEKEMLLITFHKQDDKGMGAVKSWIHSREEQMQKAEEADAHYSEELDEALDKYCSLQDDALTLDPDELREARLAIRPEQDELAVRKLQDAYGTKYDPELMRKAKADVAELLHDEPLDDKDRSILSRLHEKQHEQHTQQARSRSRKKANEQEL